MPELKKEQLEVISHEQGNILISASAGSGKTFVMIRRLIRLIVERKAKVKNVLCVTFTEASAHDMKEKLKKALIEKINQGEDLTEELLDVEVADISTIHSFCAKLIRRYFFVAGVSPDFKIADEKKKTLIVEEVLNKLFLTLYERGEVGFLTLVNRHGKYRSDKGLKELVKNIYEFIQSDKSPEGFLARSLSAYDNLTAVEEKYKRYIDGQLISIKNFLEKTAVACDALGFASALKIIEGYLTVIEDILSKDIYGVLGYSNFKMRKDYGRNIGEEKETLKAQINEVISIFEKIVGRVCGSVSDKTTERQKAEQAKTHLIHLFNLVTEFSNAYATAKAEENVLDFSDLEHFALKILHDQTTLESVRAEYKYIFADEYQDVNGVQEEILSLISQDNLFMVGDVKQSIYGFRGCRPEIFENKEKDMQAQGQKTVRLNHNFRSAKSILDMVNDVFSYSMTESVYGVDYSKTAMLKAGGIYGEDKVGRSKLHFIVKERAENENQLSGVYNLLEQAKTTAQGKVSPATLLIDKIIREELGKTYYNPQTGKDEYITYSDIVILNKNKDNKYVSGLVNELTALGVPITSKVQTNACDYPEIQTLIGLLKLIDCKKEDLPLVIALKSPIGGFTDEELLKISMQYRATFTGAKVKEYRNKTFCSAYEYALTAESEVKEKLNAFDRYITELRELADFLGAGGILKRIISDCSFESFLTANGGGVESLERINFFITKACGEKLYTVHEFLSLIKNVPEAFTVSPAVKENSVTIMTIHASKGLEFPVVILCGLEKSSSRREATGAIIKDFELGFAVKNYEDENKVCTENIFRGLIKEKILIEKIKEDLRLLYVGLTRASYSMHLTIELPADTRRSEFIGASKFSDYIPQSLPCEIATDLELFTGANEREVRKVIIGEGDKALSQKIKNNLNFKYPFESSTKLPLKCSVTGAINEQEKVYEYLVTEEKTGAERGTIAHLVLENLNFASLKKNDDFYAQIENMLALGVVEKQTLEKIQLEKIRNATQGILSLIGDKTVYHEQSFMAEIEGEKALNFGKDTVLVQGVIDLLALSENTAVIVDYKYSNLTAQSLKEKYQTQLNLYGLAVEKVLGRKVEKKALVNLLSGEIIFV